MTSEIHHYLTKTGWFKSRETSLAQTREGDPLPWLTYASIQFLEPRIHADFHVFEFGCGQSTLWWANRVSRVMSCEHDLKWAERFYKIVPKNVRLIHVPLDINGKYCLAAAQASGWPHIIVIDGRDRINCAIQSAKCLDIYGVIIWDNTERERYAPGKKWLSERGFRELEFWGLGPINADEWCTSIFYRDKNCLGI